MKNFKSNMALFLLITAMATTPFTSFAKVNENYANNDVSVWSKFFGNFWGVKASAQTRASLTPRISGITAPTYLKTGQVGTWTVKASDPKNSTLSYAVDFGDQAQGVSEKKIVSEPVFTQTSTFTHAYSKAGTYTIKFTVSNESGLKTNSTTTVHVSGKPVIEAPLISNVSVDSIDTDSAVVTWNTNLKANTSLWYGDKSPLDTTGKADKSKEKKTLTHKIKIDRLNPNTTYYVVVGSANKGGKTLSSEVSFTTKAEVDEDAPVIVKLDGSKDVVAGTETTVTVEAYDPKNDSLAYSADWGDSAMIRESALIARGMPVFTQTSTFNHIYLDAGTYTATFTAENSIGKQTSKSIEIVVKEAPADTEAPVIAAHENITTQATSEGGAIVTYTAPKVTDNVDATTTATCSPASGSTFAVGDTKVFCNYTDANGNKAIETSFTVTVTPKQ